MQQAAPMTHSSLERNLTVSVPIAQIEAEISTRLKKLALRKRWTQAQWNQLRALIDRCGGFDYARSRASELADEARGLLSSEPDGAARRALDRAVDYAVRRDH